VKAFTYLGQAYLQLNNPVKSFEASQRAYTLAIEQRSRSISIIAATCLDAKKADWEQKEKVRIQRESTLLRETCSLLMHNAEQMAWDLPSGEAQKLRTEAGKKCRELEDVFGKSEAERLGRREVPEWLIDNITFGIMWDPVVVCVHVFIVHSNLLLTVEG
jgi:STIP1 family protein 1